MAIMVDEKVIRKLAIKLLDDENGEGINREAYVLLTMLMAASGNEDILKEVNEADNRAFIGEDFAEEELKKLDENQEKAEVQ